MIVLYIVAGYVALVIPMLCGWHRLCSRNRILPLQPAVVYRGKPFLVHSNRDIPATALRMRGVR